jgi:hypothetical protein
MRSTRRVISAAARREKVKSMMRRGSVPFSDEECDAMAKEFNIPVLAVRLILWSDAWPGPLARLRCLRISLCADDDATLDEVLVTIKSELVKLGPHIGLDPNQLLEGAENRSPVTVNGSEPEAISPLRRRSPGMSVSSA